MQGWKIYNLESELLIYDVDGKDITYMLKEGAKINADSGRIIIVGADGNTYLDKTPEEITLPTPNGLYELTTILKGYLANASVGQFSGGWADYNDFETTGTPITITGGAGFVALTNDTLGANTNTDHLPFGVPSLWDASTNKLDFTGLSVGDVISVRVVFHVIVATNNTQIDGVFSFGSGGTAFTVPFLASTNYKATGTFQVPATFQFYIGSEDVLENGAQIMVKSDTTCTVTVDGWYIVATKISA